MRQDATPKGRIAVLTTFEQRSEKKIMSPPTTHFVFLLALGSILPLQVFPVVFFKVARYPFMYLAFDASDLASVTHITSASASRAVSETFSQFVEFQQFEFQNTILSFAPPAFDTGRHRIGVPSMGPPTSPAEGAGGAGSAAARDMGDISTISVSGIQGANATVVGEGMTKSTNVADEEEDEPISVVDVEGAKVTIIVDVEEEPSIVADVGEAIASNVADVEEEPSTVGDVEDAKRPYVADVGEAIPRTETRVEEG